MGLVRDPDRPLGVSVDLLRAMADRRLAHEPVSRILGRREFWGLSLAISPDVLDPRPETEGLVGSIIDAIGGQKDRPFNILDLGTGSGAILCALLSELPRAFGLGIDCSMAACRVARANLTRLGYRDRAAIVRGSWADSIGGLFDIVVSNPPYIPRGDIASLDREVRVYDPAVALDGGEDGLEPCRSIAPRLVGLMNTGGMAGVECGFDQGESVATLLRRAGLSNVMVYRDLACHDRVVIGFGASHRGDPSSTSYLAC